MVQLSLSRHRPLQVPQVAQPGLGSVLASPDLQLVSSLFLHTAMAGKRLLIFFLSLRPSTRKSNSVGLQRGHGRINRVC